MKQAVIFAVLTALASIALADRPGEDGDWQLWLTPGVSVKANGCTYQIEEEVYIGNDMKDIYYYHTDVGVSRSLTDWFSLGLNYRHATEDKGEEWVDEDRGHVNGTFKWKRSNCAFSNRSRVEYRARETKDDVWRYRNKTTIKFPALDTGVQFQPYVADEVYFDLHGDEITRNRVYGGVGIALTKRLKADLSYFWQRSDKGHEWIDNNIVHLKLKASF